MIKSIWRLSCHLENHADYRGVHGIHSDFRALAVARTGAHTPMTAHGDWNQTNVRNAHDPEEQSNCVLTSAPPVTVQNWTEETKYHSLHVSASFWRGRYIQAQITTSVKARANLLSRPDEGEVARGHKR